MALGVTCTSIENLTNSFDMSIPIYRRYSFIDYSRIREFPSIGIFANQCLRCVCVAVLTWKIQFRLKNLQRTRLAPTTLYSNKPWKTKDFFESLEKRDLDRLKLVNFPMICSCGKKKELDHLGVASRCMNQPRTIRRSSNGLCFGVERIVAPSTTSRPPFSCRNIRTHACTRDFQLKSKLRAACYAEGNRYIACRSFCFSENRELFRVYGEY